MLVEQRNSLKGEIDVPGDKSISHRAIVFGSIAKGTTEIDNCLINEDCMSTIECFRKMQIGADILPGGKVRIHGKGLYGLKQPAAPLNTGKSGTTIRLLLGILPAQPFNTVITRPEPFRRESLGKVIKPLKEMGAVINSRESGEYCPLFISPSKLKGIVYELSIPDTHIKSPILIAGLYADSETIVVEPVKSRDHTELMMNSFGANIMLDEKSALSHRVENLYAQQIEVPGDISIAAYFIAAGLIVQNSDITIKNVGVNPTRTGVLDILKSMGASIELRNLKTLSNEPAADIWVKSSSLKGVNIEGSSIPRLLDEIPVIAVAAAFAQGTTTISGLKGFKFKESGKLKCLAAELSKMGASAYETDDGMVIEGGKPLRGTIVECYNDDSIAMALSIAGLAAEGETMVRKAQVIDITFPEFFTVLNAL